MGSAVTRALIPEGLRVTKMTLNDAGDDPYWSANVSLDGTTWPVDDSAGPYLWAIKPPYYRTAKAALHSGRKISELPVGIKAALLDKVRLTQRQEETA